MLDIKEIRNDPEKYRDNLDIRGDQNHLDRFETLLSVDQRYRTLIQEVNKLRGRRNELSKEIAMAKREGKDTSELQEEATTVQEDFPIKEKELAQLEVEVKGLLMRLPNLLHESVPYGVDASENQEIRTWGEVREVDFPLKSHAEVVEELGLADFNRAAKVSGTGFNYLMGDLALLDHSLQRFALDYLVKRGYTPILTPQMMRRKPYEGVTDLGDFEDVMYKIHDEDLYLIATSEHPIAARFQDEIIPEEYLPLKFAGLSSCYRKEIGAHGVDTRGLFRMHQFNKVEQFIFCTPEISWEMHEELLANTEGMFQEMEIPYRVVNVCTGDIGIVAAKKYDLEAWSPRQKDWGEVASCSNCTDYLR